MSTPNHFATHRQTLEQRRAQLRGEIHANDASALEQVNSTTAHVVIDRKTWPRSSSPPICRAPMRRDILELAQVEAALRRLDAGTYGDCIDCGNVIAPARLRVQPAALRCAACQAAVESRRG